MIEDVARLSFRREHDVCGDDVHPARDRPRVEVVDVADAGRVEDVAADMVEVDTTRRRFQEDVQAVTQQCDGPGDDEDGDDQGGKRVRLVPAGEQDDDAGHEDRDRPEEVAKHFEVCAADREALAATG